MWFVLLDGIYLYALYARNETTNLQSLASLLKEAAPRKAQPELVGCLGEGSRGEKHSLVLQ